jgi:ankyrin repeat protein
MLQFLKRLFSRTNGEPAVSAGKEKFEAELRKRIDKVLEEARCRDAASAPELRLSEEEWSTFLTDQTMMQAAKLFNEANDSGPLELPPGAVLLGKMEAAVTMRGMLRLKVALQEGEPANGPSGEEGTPLRIAIKAGSTEKVRLLLTCGADPHARAPDGRTPLDVAKESANAEIRGLFGL